MQSDLLDSVIGVVFVWFLLSTVLSAVNEGIALVTRTRAKHLWLGIGRLIDPVRGRLSSRFVDTTVTVPVRGTRDLRPVAGTPGDPAAAPELRQADTPVPRRVDRDYWTMRPELKASDNTRSLRERTQELYQELAPQVVEVAKPGRLSKITRIGGAAFAEGVLALAKNVHKADVLHAARDAGWEHARVDQLDAALGVDPAAQLESADVAALAAPGFATGDELRDVYQRATAIVTGRDVIDFFEDNPEISRALRRAADAAAVNERVAAVKKVVETWFEREMDQLSAFYRRESRKILAVLAVPLVLFCHANAIAIFDDLHHDAGLRQATLNAAVANSVGQTLDSAMQQNCQPAGSSSSSSTTSTVPPSSTATTDPVDAAADQFRCASTIIQRATAFRVGFAWQDLKAAHGASGTKAEFEAADVPAYVWHALSDDWGFLGRSLTLVALLFGAQFWFDVLRRMIGLRKAIGSQDESAPS